MKKILLFTLFLIINFSLAQKEGIDFIQSKTTKIIINIIRFLFSVLMIMASILLIFLGIKYMTSQGKVEKLHEALLYLIIGIVLLITSLFIPNLIKNFIESLIQ